jgi:hypothetical protein
MTYAPETLSVLARYWTEQGGVTLGIVGNRAHTVGYHLGRDRIYDGSGPGIGDQDYSVQHSRDKAGLSNAASAMDLGRLGGTLAGLQRFSRWLVARAMEDPMAHRDIREVIYSPDGVKVQRWSGIDNLIHTTPGNGDDSHRTHTHISFFRDSVGRSKVPLFAPYFIPDTSTGDTMAVALNGTDRKFASTHARDLKVGTQFYRTTTETLTRAPRDLVVDDYGYPVDTPGWAAVGASSAGYDADSEGENGIALVKTDDAGVGPVRRKTLAELAAAAERFADVDAARREGAAHVKQAAVKAAAELGA